jgi:hypothetical protein
VSRFQNCIDEVRKASGVALSDADAEAFFEAVAARFKTKKAKAGPETPDAELYAQAGKELGREALAAAAIEKRNAIENLRKRVARRGFYDRAGDPVLGIEAKLVGVNTPMFAGRLSVDAQARALTKDYVVSFAHDLEKTGVFESARAGVLDRQIAQELFELNRDGGTPGVSGSAQALDVARAIASAQERARTGLNKAGAWIGKYDGYIARTAHDMDLIRRSTYGVWRDFVAERLDIRTFEGADTPGAREAFLRSVYDALSSGVHLGAAGHQGFKDPAFKGPGNLAKRLSQSRVLHWKDADAWFDYREKFSRGTLTDDTVRAMENAARHTALMREFGTNPRAELDADIAWARETHRTDHAAIDRLANWEKPLHNRMDELDGTANMPVNMLMARIGAGWRAWQSMSSLGGVLLSAITDVPMKAAELRHQFGGYGLLDGYVNGIVSPFRGRGRSPETRAILDDLRAGFEGMRGNLAARFDATDTVPGTLSKLANTFFKLTGLTYWTDAQRDGAMFAMAKHLGRQKDTPFDKLPEAARRVLEQYSIDDADWNALRTADWRGADGRTYLTPKAVDGVANTAIPDGRGVSAWREETALKLHAYFADRADHAVLQPGARERAILRQGTQAGTPEGEALRLIGQFKAFPVAVIAKAWGRELYGGQGGYGAVAGIAHMMVATAVFGYAAMSLKDLAKGRAPRDPDDPKTWAAAFVQGGGAGIYGDFIVGEYSRFGRSAVEALAGPTASDAAALFEIFNRAKKGDDAAAQSFKFAIDNAPFANLFYTRWALDYLFLYQIQETLNPGFLRRMEDRIKRENKQQFILSPAAAIPYGGGGRILEGVRE